MTKKTVFLLYLIVVIGLFLRLYKFNQTLNLDTDQGAAFLLAERIVNHGHLLLVGPLTSIWQANLLPPNYYYLIALLYFFLRNEVLISLSFTFAGVMSIVVIFFLSKMLLRTKTALLAAFLYSVSETMIYYSRNIWEPYLVPLFVMMAYLSLLFFGNKRKIIYLVLSIILFFSSFFYISPVLILPVYFLYLLKIYRQTFAENKIWPVKIISLFLFVGLLYYLPNIFHESLKNFPTLNYLWEVMTGRTDYVKFDVSQFLTSINKHWYLFLTSVFIYLNKSIYIAVSASLFFMTLLVYVKDKKSRPKLNFIALNLMGIIFTGIYSQKAEVYRLSALYPFFFILFAFLIRSFLVKTKGWLIVPLFIYFIVANLLSLSEISTLNGMNKFEIPFKTAKLILEQAENASFTIFTKTPDEKSNHHSTTYWYALEKISAQKFTDLNESGNWINQDLVRGKNWIFLICKNFPNTLELEINCWREFIEKERLSSPRTSFKIDNLVIFKIPDQI